MSKPKKPKPTNKDFEIAILDLMRKNELIINKVNAIDRLLALYLEYKKDGKEFDKFVKDKAKEVVSQDED
jgi:hypothetical protein